jgi:hypothetical protein
MARRDADEWLDVVLKHLLQNETVINRKTAKSINAANWNSVPHRLRIERFFCIPISGNTGVEIKHFDAVSERERHWINLKVPGVYVQKHSFVIIFMPNRKPQNHFFGTRPEFKEKDGWTLRKKSIFMYKSLFTLYRYLFSLYMLYSLLFSRK